MTFILADDDIVRHSAVVPVPIKIPAQRGVIPPQYVKLLRGLCMRCWRKDVSLISNTESKTDHV